MDGADYLIGGDGNDTASYTHANEGVVATLISGDTHFGSDAIGDDYFEVENLTGSNFGDILGGDGGDNTLTGGLENDTLRGEGGNDVIFANQDHDSAYGGDGNDTFYVSSVLAHQATLVDGGADLGGSGDILVLEGLGASYDFTATTLATATSNIETLNIRDTSSTTLTISSQNIQSMVDDGASSILTIHADSGDSLVIALDTGESMSPTTFTPGVDNTYTISIGATQTAQIFWDVA